MEVLGPRPGPKVVRAVLDGAAHVLRLDQDLSPFYLLAEDDPDLAWATTGAGRMLRSPTVFEDVVKTVCTTNCAWSATVRMVDALVTHLGDPALGGDGPLTNAFPTPAAMAGVPESFYREVVRAGYRGAYLIGARPRGGRGRARSRGLRDGDARRNFPTSSSRPRCSRCPASGRTPPRTS